MSFLLLSTLNFFDGQVGWTILDHSGPFLFSKLFCGTPPSCLKVMGWVVVVGGGGGLQDFSVSPSPLWVNMDFELDWTGLRLGLRGLGTRVWEWGLTIL